MSNLPKPLEMTDSEILDFLQSYHGKFYFGCTQIIGNFNGKEVYAPTIRQAVCQAAAILKEQEK